MYGGDWIFYAPDAFRKFCITAPRFVHQRLPSSVFSLSVKNQSWVWHLGEHCRSPRWCVCMMCVYFTLPLTDATPRTFTYRRSDVHTQAWMIISITVCKRGPVICFLPQGELIITWLHSTPQCTSLGAYSRQRRGEARTVFKLKTAQLVSCPLNCLWLG